MLSEKKPNNIKYWDPCDTLELFEKNWGSDKVNKQSRQLLIENGYTLDTIIEYQIDHYGLRNPYNIDISNSILTLGCSYTFGTGLDRKDTWPFQLGSILNESTYNAGLPGTSNDTAFRLANYLVPKYKPKGVILLATFSSRYEFYNDNRTFNTDKFYNYIAAADKVILLNNGEFELNSDLHNELNTRKNILAIKCLCNESNICLNVEDIKAIPGDNARDLDHPGRRTHKFIAQKIAKLYQNH